MFDCVFFYRNGFILILTSNNIDEFQRSFFYKLNIKVYIVKTFGNQLIFKKNFSYLKFKKLLLQLQENAGRYNITFSCDESVSSYLKEKELHIEERYKLGNEIKHHDNKLLPRFEKYRECVDSLMVRPLRERQMWDSFFMYAMQKTGNFSVPGSGKTASALGVFAYLYEKKHCTKIVVFCPKNAFGSWIDEFYLSFGNKLALNYFLLHRKLYKNTQEKKNAILYDSGNANLLLFNYESLKTYSEEISQIIDEDTLLIFDEVHKVKKINGEYATNALKIAENAHYSIAMTGTPIPNSYLDIYNLLHILFPNEYDDFFGFELNILKNPDQNKVNSINKRIQPFFCRTNKNQLSVPLPNPDSIDFFSASNAENELFNILMKKYRKNKLALFLRILQLETNPKLLLQSLDLVEFSHILDIDVKNEEKIDFVDYSENVKKLIESINLTTKFAKCLQLIEQLVKEGKTVIIWCIFKDSIRNLAKALRVRDITAKCIYGEVELEERQQLLTAFKNNEYDVLITNPHTLAESVSLHSVCHDAVYFEYSYNLVHLLQSKDRIHRLGLPQNQYTQYFYLQENYQMNGEEFSLAKKVYDRLLEKEQIMLNAIDKDVLETMPTSDEELEIIFKNFDSE